MSKRQGQGKNFYRKFSTKQARDMKMEGNWFGNTGFSIRSGDSKPAGIEKVQENK
jgi:hypothetical protein